MGRHLLALGLPPGPQLGQVLNEAYEAQLEGEFATLAAAYRWLASRTDLNLSKDVEEALEAVLEQQ